MSSTRKPPAPAAKPAAKKAPAAKSAPASTDKSTTAKAAAGPASEVAAKTSATAANTITLKQLAGEIADSHELSRKDADTILNGVVETMVAHLKSGNRIRLSGLGILEVKVRAARTGRNPATGEQIEIKASKKVAFRAAKELKEAV